MSRHLSKAPAAGKGRGWRIGVGIGLLVVACAILLMLAAMLAMRMPVSLLTRNLDLPPAVVALRGSVMAGRAVLDGGNALQWNSDVRVLPLPHLRTDLTLEGPDTRLTGWIRTGFGGIAMNALSGRAGPGLAAIATGAWDCDMNATVRDVSLSWTWQRAGASGEVTTPEGVCRMGSQEAALPPLRVDLSRDGKDAVARLSSDGLGQIAQARLARARHIDLTIDPAMADIFPGLPRGGPIRLQLPF